MTTSKDDRKRVKARFFVVDKANTNLSYNSAEVLDLLKRALDEKPKISDRQLILNKSNNDDESDILAHYEWNANNTYLFGLIMRIAPESSTGSFSPDVLNKEQCSIDELITKDSINSICTDHYYFILNNNYLITNLTGLKNIDCFQTYINWLTEKVRGDQLIAFVPKTTLPKDVPISSLRKLEFGDNTKIMTDLNNQKEKVSTHIKKLSSRLLKALLKDSDYSSLEDIDLEELISAKLIISVKRKSKDIDEDDFQKIMGTILKPLTNDSGITLIGKNGEKLSGSDIKKVECFTIDKTSRGHIDEAQLKQKFEECLFKLKE
jgi:hypothetical protein|nr:MAG TPA_asm: hypothetical protein [Caudoviricetes sp.]